MRYDGPGSTPWDGPGLHKVAPGPADVTAQLQQRIAALAAQLADLEDEVTGRRTGLRGLRAQTLSLAACADTRQLSRERRGELRHGERQLAARAAERARLTEELEAHQNFVCRPPAPEPVQAHVRRRHVPYAAARDPRARFLRIWAALSTPLLILAVVAILIGLPVALLTALAGLGLMFAAVEAVARRRLLAFLTALAVTCLAVTAAIVLTLGVLRHWQTLLAAVLAIGALAALVINLQELRRGR